MNRWLEEKAGRQPCPKNSKPTLAGTCVGQCDCADNFGVNSLQILYKITKSLTNHGARGSLKMYAGLWRSGRHHSAQSYRVVRPPASWPVEERCYWVLSSTAIRLPKRDYRRSGMCMLLRWRFTRNQTNPLYLISTEVLNDSANSHKDLGCRY